MQLDEVTAEIRPRSDWEAVDLGLAMVRRDFWRCFSVWWLAVILPTVVAAWLLWDSPILLLLLFWWWKPAGSRMVLFEVSRRLFGERPTWPASLRRIPGAWSRRFFYRFVWARLSPWLPVTMAVEDLEGLRGKAYKQRSNQVTRRGDGVVMWIYFIADVASCWFGLAIVLVLRMFIPEGQGGGWSVAVETWNPDNPLDLPLIIMRTVVGCVMLAISLTDVFVSGAGFGIYINNRTAMEGWDVELAFRRIARRLAKVSVMVMVLVTVCMPAVSRADVEWEAANGIREVKADPAFKVHTVTDKVRKKNASGGWREWLKWFGFGSMPSWMPRVFMISSLALLVGVIAWLIWKNRHAFMIKRGGGGGITNAPQSARVVMGMEVSPETLPGDVPSAVLDLWRSGRHQEALGLLYRGAISRVMEIGRVEIQESDTEGDCQRRVEQAGAIVHPDYFRGITDAWMALAYAGRRPNDLEVESLCREWPFVERREK